ncbi:hypothetical protein Tco_0378150 [Tanacetum coccineum]
MHLKETTSNSIETPKPEIKVYSKRPKQVKTIDSSKTTKIVESNIPNNSKPNHSWGSNATDVPSSSSLVNDRLSRLFFGSVRFRNDQIEKIMGYGDYQLGNIIISRVYYVEGLGHNLFLVGQSCNADFEVAFLKKHLHYSEFRRLESTYSRSRDTNFKSKKSSSSTQWLKTLTKRKHLSFAYDLVARYGGEHNGKSVEEPILNAHFDDPYHEPLHDVSISQESSSNAQSFHSPLELIGKCTMDHPLANVIGNPSQLVSTRKQLKTDAMWCYFDAFLTSVEPKNFKEAILEPSWIDAMQEETYEFERLQV